MLTVKVVAAVANHGVDQNLIDRQFAASKAFFALPLSTKLKLKVRSHAVLKGCNRRVDRLLHCADGLSLPPCECNDETLQGNEG